MPAVSVAGRVTAASAPLTAMCGSLWLLTPDSASSNRSWSINSSGNASVNGNGKGSTSNGLLVFPSLFLSSNVKIISGNGSINNPYQLGV